MLFLNYFYELWLKFNKEDYHAADWVITREEFFFNSSLPNFIAQFLFCFLKGLDQGAQIRRINSHTLFCIYLLKYLASPLVIHPSSGSSALNQMVLSFAFLLQMYFFRLFAPSFLCQNKKRLFFRKLLSWEIFLVYFLGTV